MTERESAHQHCASNALKMRGKAPQQQIPKRNPSHPVLPSETPCQRLTCPRGRYRQHQGGFDSEAGVRPPLIIPVQRPACSVHETWRQKPEPTDSPR
jgi:hypothetical protein